ncbi:hypothetical protein GCM10008955_26820 [Deinococcus malanensis]|uniref:Cytochrome c domain-containing protein n=1 Tax=Deinococcus malanensis TaxID=1706855 RepID=A0ABQ2EYU4_9DEIO|nr:hypothetical protein [Deinococcus malanensis]GGK31629.1 hypothetical protein GCM10008955_26820 [Deinococcus malanensis]
MKGDRVRLLGAALAGLTLLSVPAALALPTYRKQAAQQFRYDRDNPLWDLDRRVVPCTYCHIRVTGGAPWNPFGEAIRAAFRADAQAGKHSKFPVILHGLLASEGDADKDGYSDALEVYARTLPGDDTSYPRTAEKEVRAAYENAGGAQQYLPPKSKK